MTFKELYSTIKCDFRSYDVTNNWLTFYFKNPGFKLIVWMRICKYLSQRKIMVILYLFSRIKYRRLQVKYGIQIDFRLNVSTGFNIHHYGGIVINKDCVIGRNFSIRHNTTLGNTEKGAPKIGDNVFVGANSVLIGNITIGDNCVIGAGSIVTRSFESNCIIAGNPAKIIKKIN